MTVEEGNDSVPQEKEAETEEVVATAAKEGGKEGGRRKGRRRRMRRMRSHSWFVNSMEMFAISHETHFGDRDLEMQSN